MNEKVTEIIAEVLRVLPERVTSELSIGDIPEWHPGAGNPGFIFIDEIWIK